MLRQAQGVGGRSVQERLHGVGAEPGRDGVGVDGGERRARRWSGAGCAMCWSGAGRTWGGRCNRNGGRRTRRRGAQQIRDKGSGRARPTFHRARPRPPGLLRRRRHRRYGSAVIEDRPAAAEVRDLLGVEQGAAEVDQVEIDAVDLGAAEVGAAEVGLADLLGTLEVLLVVVVGVEAGAAPLAGDRAADQAAAGRAEVEARLAEVGVAEVGPSQSTSARPAARRSAPRKFASGMLEPVRRRVARSASVEVGAGRAPRPPGRIRRGRRRRSGRRRAGPGTAVSP